MADETPPRKKKLPFKPTALQRKESSRPAPSSSEDAPTGLQEEGILLFSRSKEMEPIMAADRERRLRRKQKREEDERRRRSSAGEHQETGEEHEPVMSGAAAGSPPLAVHSTDEPMMTDESMTLMSDSFRDLVTPPPSKRSRLGSTSSKRMSTVEAVGAAVEESPSARRTQSHTDVPMQMSANDLVTPSKNTAPISLDSDTEDDIQDITTPSKRRRSSVEIIESPTTSAARVTNTMDMEDDEDDEFAEYVRQAQERRAKQLAAQGTGSSGTPAKHNVEILVQSQVPNSKPLRARFSLHKPLRLLRDTWFALQVHSGAQVSPDDQEGIVLTWRKKRVYNSSNLLDLGLLPDGHGKVFDSTSRHGADRASSNVLMEAWTPALFAKMEHDEEVRRKQEAGELPDDYDEGGPEGSGNEPAEPEIKLRIILKARDAADVRLTVRPETTVETLITGYKKTSKTPVGGKNMSLWFDGDMLEEHVTMEDGGLEDMDTIEVHFK